MCGIFGVVGNIEKSDFTKGVEAIAHRGPDSFASEVLVTKNLDLFVNFGHRRLAIIDLTPAGAQPMTSHSGRFTVIFNGEIYNHLEIKKELKFQAFRGHSDTEILLAAMEEWGIEATFKKCIGMFAIAIWDHREEKLSLVRDRAGEKPLYYGWIQNDKDYNFVFGSELKSFIASHKPNLRINKKAMKDFLKLSVVPSPETIFESVYKLNPGSILTYSPEAHPAPQKNIQIHPYWELKHSYFDPSSKSRPAQESIERLDLLLTDSIRNQMIADVPLGAFLSGGVDSSLVVAIASKISSQKIKTFTVKFRDPKGTGEFDESTMAGRIAEFLGTDHTTIELDQKELLDFVPQLPFIFDEPFADSSQLPTLAVSRAARRHVTVALSGDAGDELFLGYNRHLFAHKYMQQIHQIPKSIRGFIGDRIEGLSQTQLKTLSSPLKSLMSQPDEKIRKIARVLSSPDLADYYKKTVTAWPEIKDFELPKRWQLETEFDRVTNMAAADFNGYMNDDILVKVDRSSMASSLETRAPFLDHRIIELAFSLPDATKLYKGEGKCLTKELKRKHFEGFNYTEAPKMGFSLPLADLLRGELKSWAEQTLFSESALVEELIPKRLLEKKWNEHQSARINHHTDLWNVIMLKQWLQYWKFS